MTRRKGASTRADFDVVIFGASGNSAACSYIGCFPSIWEREMGDDNAGVIVVGDTVAAREVEAWEQSDQLFVLCCSVV